jgi:hypothetical protein
MLSGPEIKQCPRCGTFVTAPRAGPPPHPDTPDRRYRHHKQQAEHQRKRITGEYAIVDRRHNHALYALGLLVVLGGLALTITTSPDYIFGVIIGIGLLAVGYARSHSAGYDPTRWTLTK